MIGFEESGLPDSSSKAVSSEVTLDELDALLRSHGVDSTQFSKTLNDLHHEIAKNDCFPYEIEGQLVRLVQPVFIKLVYGCKTLVNVKDIIVTRGNQERGRNSLLSEKMFPGETPLGASKRALREELTLPIDAVEASVTHMIGEDRTQTNTMKSKSYDGLTSVYKKHLIVLNVKEDAPITALIGLPDYSDFSTTEVAPHKTVQHYWSWLDHATAKASVVGANFDEIF